MKIFLSAADPALSDIREALVEQFTRWDHQVLSAKDLDSSHQKDQQARNRLLSEADIFVSVYAHRYGEIGSGESISYEEGDYRHAMSSAKEIFCFLIDPKQAWPEQHVEDDFIKKQRLEELIDDMRKQQDCSQFTTAQEIVTFLEPRFKKLTLIYDRIKLLRQWSERQPQSQKFKKLSDLADQMEKGRLQKSDFAASAALILGDFKSRHVDTEAPLFGDVARVMKDQLSAAGLADGAAKIGRKGWKDLFSEWMPYSLILALGLGVLMAGWLGFSLGQGRAASNDAALNRILLREVPQPLTLSFISSDAGESAREALAFVGDQNPDHDGLLGVLAELENSVDEALAAASDSSSKRSLLIQLQRLCQEPEPFSFCQRTVELQTALQNQQSNRLAAEALDAIKSSGKSGEALLEEYRAFLTAHPTASVRAEVEGEIKNIQASLKRDQLQAAREDSLADAAREAALRETAQRDSLARVEKLRADSIAAEQAKIAAAETARRDSIARATASRVAAQQARQDSLANLVANRQTPAQPTNTTNSLPPSSNTPEEGRPESAIEPLIPGAPLNSVPVEDAVLREHITRLNADTLTVNQQLAGWQALLGSASPGSNTQQYASAETALLIYLIENTATLDDPENFVTARQVNRETYMPEEISDRFEPGRVWMWARMIAPRQERVYARWYSKGRLYYTSQAAINRPSEAYRIYFTKTYTGSTIGPAEVRFYNEADLLIARKKFEIVPISVTQDQGN